MPVHGKGGKDDEATFPTLSTDLGNRYCRFTHSHADHDEDEYLLKPAGLRDKHSEGKVKQIDVNATNRM